MTLASVMGPAGRRSALRAAAAILALVWLSIAALPARADADYDPKRAGNPVRIAAYVVHPVGVLLDYLIFRPAWWIGQHEPFKTIFGVTD
jgi:hypothetical protein